MSKVFVYGASDDLVEIEGDDGLREEFDIPGEAKVLLISPSEAVEVVVRLERYWSATATFIRGNPLIRPRPRFAGEEDDDMGLEIEFEDGPIRAYLLDHRTHVERH
jgi:hypothetical protein